MLALYCTSCKTRPFTRAAKSLHYLTYPARHQSLTPVLPRPRSRRDKLGNAPLRYGQQLNTLVPAPIVRHVQA